MVGQHPGRMAQDGEDRSGVFPGGLRAAPKGDLEPSRGHRQVRGGGHCTGVGVSPKQICQQERYADVGSEKIQERGKSELALSLLDDLG